MIDDVPPSPGEAEETEREIRGWTRFIVRFFLMVIAIGAATSLVEWISRVGR